MFSPATIFIISFTIAAYLYHRKQKRSRLPPGPHGLPFIGNLLQAPTEAIWTTYERWIEQYGPLVYANFGGTDVLLIGDYEVAKELLDKKANIYSDRPRMVSGRNDLAQNKPRP